MAGGAERPGMLIVVAGPSGSGKDTLISFARHALGDDPRFSFPPRVITRADQSGEDHIHVSPKHFERLRRQKLFFLDWDAHGFSYGIPANIQDELDQGRAVIFNISRRMIPAARTKWQPTAVISVMVAADELRRRLRSRGRETEAEIEARVSRASDHAGAIGAPVHILDNSGPIEGSAARFLALLKTLVDNSAAEAVPAYGLEDAGVQLA